MKALRSTLLCLFFISALSLLSGAALAQEDATVEAARERFKEGVEYFDNKEYERARLAFLQAYALKPHPAVLLNLAQSEVRSGHEAAAATHFAQYLREHADATDEQRQAAQEGLETAKKSVGVVTLTVEQSGAEIIVDGESVGRSPLDDALYLSPGEHTIVAQKDGETARTRLSVEAGTEVDRNLSIGSSPVSTSTGAPASEAGDAAGAGDDDGDDDAAESVGLNSEEYGGGRQPFFSWFSETPVAWLGAGLAAAGIGSGIGFGISAKNWFDAANETADEIELNALMLNEPSQGVCNQPWGQPAPSDYSGPPPWKYEDDPGFREACADFREQDDTGNKYKTYSTVGFIAGGAFAVGTVVYYFIDASKAGPDAAKSEGPATAKATALVETRLIPMVSRGEAGVLLLGRF